MKLLLIKAITIYQKMPLSTHAKCRFYPTCSEYTKEAIYQYGSLKGILLGIKRILRCNPWSKSTYDPVPRKNGGHYEKV